MSMRAGRQIKKGAEITNSYVDPQVMPREKQVLNYFDFSSGSVSCETRIAQNGEILPL